MENKHFFEKPLTKGLVGHIIIENQKCSWGISEMKASNLHSNTQFYFSYGVRYWFTYSTGLFLRSKNEYIGQSMNERMRTVI